MQLRDYQQQTIDNVFDSYNRGINSGIIKLGTGLGKSHVATQIAKQWRAMGKGKFLFLVDQIDLAFQAKKAFKKTFPNMTIGLEMNSHHAEGNEDIIISCVPSIGRKGTKRIGKFDPDEFTAICCDEAHKSLSNSWLRVLHYLGVHPENFTDGKLLIGLTATPQRKGGGLGFLYHDFFANYDVIYGMREGWLVTPEWIKIKTGINIDSVKKKSDEYSPKELEQLAEIIAEEKRNQLIYKAFVDEGSEKTIVYCATVAHAYQVKELFESNGTRAEVIEALTDKDDRQDWMEEFRSGDLNVLLNFGTLCLDSETDILTSEGWVGMNEMTYEHKVGNYHPDTKEITFSPPKHITIRDRKPNERMVTLQTKRMNFRVTEDHRMLCYNNYKKEFYESKAKDIVGKLGFFPMCGYNTEAPSQIEIEQKQPLSPEKRNRRIIGNSHSLRKRNPGMTKEFSKTYVDQWLTQQENDNQYKKVEDLSLDECQFLGFFMGDGSLNKGVDGGYKVTFSASPVYTEIINWFDCLLNRLGLNYHRGFQKNKSNGGIRWTIPRGTGGYKQEAKGFEPYWLYLNKRDTKWLFGLNKEQFDAFLFGFHLADGEHGNDVPDKLIRTKISTTFHGLMNDIQALAVTFGYRCSLSYVNKKEKNHNDQLCIYISRVTNEFFNVGKVKPSFEEDWKPEKVWCVTTDSTFIITRRKGRVIITGNSTGIDFPDLKAIILARPIGSDVLYQQILGRVLRPSSFSFVDAMPDAESRRMAISMSDKPFAKVIDLVDTCSAVRLRSPLTLLGINDKMKTEDRVKVYEQVYEPLEKVKHEHGIDISEVTDMGELDSIVTRQRGIDYSLKTPESISDLTNVKWLEAGDEEYEVILGKAKKTLYIQKNLVDKWELHEYDLTSKSGAGKLMNTFNTLAGALRVGDELIEQRYKEDYRFVYRNWSQQHKPPSEKQINLILKLFGRGMYTDKQYYELPDGTKTTYNRLWKRGFKGESDTLIDTMEVAGNIISARLNR